MALAGALVPFSLAPYNFAALAFLSTLIVLVVLNNCTIKQAFQHGYWYGVSLFGIGVHWLYISIHEHGNASPLLAGGLTLGLILCALAFFPACKLLIYKYLETKFTHSNYHSKYKNIFLLVNLPTIWVIFDWIQSWFLTGFPWLYLGYSQILTPLSGFAPILSVFGVTWFVIFNTILIYFIIKNIIKFIYNNNNQYTLNACLNYMVILIVVFITGRSLQAVEWTVPKKTAEQVVLVQGNIAQVNRWDPELFLQNIKTYEKLTHPYWKNSTIIWPESAVSLPLPYAEKLITELSTTASNNQSTLILGIPRLANTQQQFFNSIIAIGKGQGSHNKNKLVPWGEYVPFENILRGIIAFFNLPMSNFISGNVITPNFGVLQSENLRWLPFICYEIAYPSYVIDHASQGDAIITISNDAWFGDSIGPWQHLQLVQMRALETARPVIRATNNGITAVIDSHGKIIQQIPQFEENVLVYENLYGFEGITPIMYYGVNSVIFLLLIMITGSCYLLRRKSRSQELVKDN